MTSEHAFIAHPIFKADSGKVEKILEGSLDSIPSPSSFCENSNYGWESLLEV